MAKIKMKYKEFELEIDGDESFIDSKVNDLTSILDKVVANCNDRLDYQQVESVNQLTYTENNGVKKNKKVSVNPSVNLNDVEKEIVAEISHLDRYEPDAINKIKELTKQKEIVAGAILLLFNVDNNVLFNANILYNFIRKIGLCIERQIISARMSDMKSYFDKQDNHLYSLSNYGKGEIEKMLNIVI